MPTLSGTDGGFTKVSADVLAGNRKGEAFYERKGFEPAERLDAELFGEPAAERRWWRPAAASEEGRHRHRP